MKRYIRRLVPMGFQDIPAIEGWLSDLAGEGLFLAHCGGYFARLEKGKPAKTTYRLEPAVNLSRSTAPDEKKAALFAEFGWEFVCTFGNYFHVYRSNRENPPEIHTDPQEQAELFARICRAQAFYVLYYIILLFLLYQSGALFASSLADIVYHGLPFVLGSLIWLVFPLAEGIRLFRLARIFLRLKKGEPLPHSGKYRDRYPLRLLLRVSPALPIALFLLCMLSSRLAGWEMDWREAPEAFPMVALAELEQEPSLETGLLPETIARPDGNEARFRSTFLAPTQACIVQSGYVPGRECADGGSAYDPELSLSLYRLRFPSLAGPLLQSLMGQYKNLEWETLEGQSTDVDEAYYASSPDSETRKWLFLRAGGTVICADYSGEADLRPSLPQFAALAQAEYPAKQ